jgi:hypothetical protein
MERKMAQNKQELVIYKSKDGTVELKATLEQETIWLDAHQMAELFGRDRTVILRHLRNVYNTGELGRKATCAKIAQVAADGKIRRMDIFNLDAIISVGYRVNSKRGTEFRIWATNVLKQHIVQGYTVNEKRLKQLGQVVKLASDISKRKPLSGDEASSSCFCPFLSFLRPALPPERRESAFCIQKEMAKGNGNVCKNPVESF